MKTPWLIQRGKFVKNLHPNLQECYKEKKGIDSIIDLDYMGSAEFEFGALPKALKRIRENKSQYVVLNTIYKEKPVTLYVPSTLSPKQIDDFLLNIETKQHKEWTAFNHYITPDEHFGTLNFDFWWDIENDIMFWKTDEEFTASFLEKI